MSLVTAAEMSTMVHEMSTNIESTKITPYIEEAQEFDIKDVLGELLYVDMLANLSAANYVKLLTGGNYTVSGKVYSFKGLKHAIAYFAFGRMIPFLAFNVTRSGIRTKANRGLDGDVSVDAERKELADFSTSCKNKGIALLNDCIRFIERNSSDYPLYSCGSETISKATVRIGAVGKTITRSCSSCNRPNCRCHG